MKGQSVQGIQIVYNTKSDLCKVFNILQIYAIFHLAEKLENQSRQNYTNAQPLSSLQ